MSKKSILIIYPYFSPAEKAGGIVSSLSNLANNLEDYQFYIYTSCYDLDSSQLNVDENSWLRYSANVNVYYSSVKDQKTVSEIISDLKPSTVYINGIYGAKFFLKAISALKHFSINTVIAPRGMLHAGALKVKPLKKWIYLTSIKLTGILKKCIWHATDAQEVLDIKKHFKNASVTLAQDTPPLKPNFAELSHIKSAEKVKLVFLSLITEKKNLLFLLQVLSKHPELKIELDVIGPIKDHSYWLACKDLIDSDNRINYLGQVAPSMVVKKLAPYDYFVLPTLGENFGHVIFEALTAGTPVITTHFTPWVNLKDSDAGYNLNLKEEEWLHLFKHLINQDDNEYTKSAYSAQLYLKKYLSSYTPKEDYKLLFD